MDERLISQALQDAARKDIPDDMNMWPEVQARMGRVTRSAARSRVSWVAVAVLAMLAVSVVAYAAVLLQGGSLDPGMQGASEADLVTTLNQSQTVGGLTVTLNYAYADSNRVSLDYESSGTAPPGTSYQFTGEKLTDSAGREFQSMFGGGGGGGGSQVRSVVTATPTKGGSGGGGGSEDGSQARSVVTATPSGGGGSGSGGATESASYAMTQQSSYDASGIDSSADELSLRLEVSIQQFVVAEQDGQPTTTLDEVIGPFVFDFTIPFIQGQVVEPQASAAANGQSITLERLVIAPSFTRGLVCFDPIPETSFAPLVSLTIDGESVLESEPVMFAPAEQAEIEGCFDLRINQSLYQRSGEWTLSIDALAVYYPASLSSGDDGTSVYYSFDGAPETLAKIRAVLEPSLAEYDIPLADEGGSLKFSVRHDSGIDLGEIQALVTNAAHEETPGPWTFRFTVAPAS